MTMQGVHVVALALNISRQRKHLQVLRIKAEKTILESETIHRNRRGHLHSLDGGVPPRLQDNFLLPLRHNGALLPLCDDILPPSNGLVPVHRDELYIGQYNWL